MAQSIFAGGTAYDHQTLDDIDEDINKWIQFTIDSRDKIKELRGDLENSSYWKETPYDFVLLLNSTDLCFETIISDLKSIDDGIKNERISNKEVKLLENIGHLSEKFEKRYGNVKVETFTHRIYSEEGFKPVIKIYNEGRELFLTLLDASNASARLNDYVTDQPSNTINIAGNVSNSNLQQGKTNYIKGSRKNPRNEKWHAKLFWYLIVPILVIIIGAIVVSKLGIN